MRKEQIREKLERKGYYVSGGVEEYGDVSDRKDCLLVHMTNPAPNFLKRWFHNSAKLILYRHYKGGRELEEVLIKEKIPYRVATSGGI